MTTGSFSIAVLSAAVFCGASCFMSRQYTVDRDGTIAGRIVVKDEASGEILQGAIVLVREGFKSYMANGRTNEEGEVMFAKYYAARMPSEGVWPEYLMLEVTRDGYEGVKMSVNTEKFLYGYGDKEMYKEYVVTLRKGSGMRRIENYKPDPFAGY